MKKFISPRLLRFVLKENYILFLIYALVCILFSSLFAGVESAFTGAMTGEVAIIDISSINGVLQILSILAIPLTARAFRFYTKRCDADFFEALPYTRRQIMLSTVSALSLLSLAALVVSALGSVAVASEYVSKNVFLVGDSILHVFYCWLTSNLTIAVTAVAVSMSGHTFNTMLAAFLIVSVPSAIFNSFAAMAEISPLLAGVINRDPYSTAKPELIDYIVLPVLTVFVMLVALFLFKRRKSEIATRFYANRAVGHILRVAVALSITLEASSALLSLFWGEYVVYGILGFAFLFIFSLIIYFGYELIAVRNKSAFISALKGLPFLVGVNVLVIATGLITGNVMSSVVPGEDSIMYISIESGDGYNYDSALASHVAKSSSKVRLDSDEAKKIIADALAENDKAYRDGSYDKKYIYGEESYESIKVKIGLPLGSITRTLYVSEEDKSTLDMIFAEREDYRSLWCDLPENPYAIMHNANFGAVCLDNATAAEIYEALLRDVSKMSFEEWYYANFEGSDHSLTAVVNNGGEWYKLRLPIPEIAEEASALLEEALDEKVASDYDELTQMIDRAASGADEALELSVTYRIGEDYYSAWLTVEDSEDGKALAEFLKKSITLKYPDFDLQYVRFSVETGGYSYDWIYYEFSFSEAYSTEELKEILNRYSVDY